MAAGVAFDPAEYAAFKSGLAAPAQDAAPATAAPAADAFDPAEFQAFKASRQGGSERQTRTVPNPMETVGQGPSFNDRFGDGPMASTLDTSTREGAALRGKADEMLIGKPSAANTATAALFGAGQGASMNLAGNAAAGVATVLGKFGVPGYGDGSRTFAENYDRFRGLRDAYGRQAPVASTTGTVAGTLAAAPLMPGLAGAPAASLGGRALQYGVTGGLYGAAGEALDSRDTGKALAAGGAGLVGGAVLGPVVEKIAPPIVAAAGKALAPILERFGSGAVAAADGFTPQARAVLRAAGLDADNLPPELAQHIEATFAAKGATPAAVREAQAAEFGIPLSRGQATQDPRVLAAEERALAGQSGPRAQEIGETFSARQADAVAGARDRVLGMAANGGPRVEGPQEAYEAVADRARQFAQAQAERESVAQRGVDDALRAVRGRGAPDAVDGATAAIQGVRDAADQARGAYRGAYADVGQIPGAFVPGAMDRVGSRVRVRLGSEVPIDDVLTPAATRAINDLDRVPDLFGLAPNEGPTLQQVEQLRKRLVAYRGTTSGNATDRRAVDQILSEFDGHVEDAMGAGLFGPRQAAGAAVDDFPGAAAMSAAPTPVPAAGGASAAKAEPLTHYLARNGGIALDGDARAGDLGRVMTPYGPLGRRGGRPIEDFRDQLASEGFIRPDAPDGSISRRIEDEIHDLIGQERAGQPTYRLSDLSRGAPVGDAGGRLADQNAAYVERLAPFKQQVVDDLLNAGYHPQDIDPSHLDDAAQRLFRGEHDTGADAFEAAVMGRPTGGMARVGGSAEAIPFDGLTARAASDVLPGGDTAPLAAMQRARGLFQDYKQAFAPRFAGDTAGNNLRQILERDASPVEVSRMLFGSPGSGKVQAGQTQTLARLRDAVGPDSDTWRAVQGALINRHLGGEGRDLGSRLDYLLSSDGRPLMTFLSGQQQAGLRTLKGATRQLEAARQPMPAWISDLERTGFDPNAVARSVFGGSGPVGAKPGAVLEAQAARGLLGPDSAEWAMLRQAAIHRLMDHSEKVTKTIERLNDFTTGSGKGVAQTLFSADELAQLRRAANGLASTVRPDGTIRSGAALAAGRQAAVKAIDALMGALAFKVAGPVAGAGVYKAKIGQRALVGGLGSVAARRSFEGGAPRLALPPPSYAVSVGNATGRTLAPLGSQ